MFIFAALLAVHVGLAGTIPTAPENITVTFINPQSVRVSWQIASNLLRKPIERYLVTFKPTNDRVVQQVAGHSEAVVLDHLLPNTQYQLTVTAVVRSHRYKSRQITFKTLELTRGGSGDSMAPHSGHSLGVFSDSAFTSTTGSPPNATTRELPTIRGVEVGIVVLVLIVWAGAIALFFNRWGKIRMLLPYQPDYKQEQLKVPGTGVCSGSACNGQHSHQEPRATQTPTSHPNEPLHHKEPLLHNPVVQHRITAGVYSRLLMWHCSSLANLELEDAESVSSRRQITMGYVELLQKIQDDFPDEESLKEDSIVADESVRESCQSECEGSEVGSLVNPQSKPRHFHYLDEPSTTISDRCTRNRINSAIFVSSEGRGFDSIEFLRRHGSQSVLCRKAKSAENISDEDRKRRFSDNQQWATEDSSHQSETIELVECHHTTPSNIKPALSVCTTTASIAVTTPSKFIATASAIATAINRANSIVGSISIETPPSDLIAQVQVPVPPTSSVVAQSIAPLPHQNAISSSSAPSQNVSLSTPNNSPVRLSLKTSSIAVVAATSAKQPLTNLPTLSISQPSPPAEGEFL